MNKSAVIIACIALAVPLVNSTIDFTNWPTLSLTSGGTTFLGIPAVAGLTAAQATLGGLGGLLLAVKGGALLGSLAVRASRGKRSANTDVAMDAQDCGKLYLCQVAATPVTQLTQEELTSLLLFQTGEAVSSNGKATFNEAVRLGAFTRNPKTCAQRYQRCSVRSETLTNSV